MIIQLDGTPDSTAAAQRSLQALAHDWEHDISQAAAETAPRTSGDDPGKIIDPVSLTVLALSIPSAALAGLDLADRIRKRCRASELIHHAQQLAGQQVTLTLITRTPHPDPRPAPRPYRRRTRPRQLSQPGPMPGRSARRGVRVTSGS